MNLPEEILLEIVDIENSLAELKAQVGSLDSKVNHLSKSDHIKMVEGETKTEPIKQFRPSEVINRPKNILVKQDRMYWWQTFWR